MKTSNQSDNTDYAARIYRADPAIRVLIMSSPRTGSTLLSDVLNQAGIGSDTKEFLHQDACRQHNVSSGSALSYIRKIALKHTHSNGTFLCKTHYNSFVAVFQNQQADAYAWLRYFTHFILIKRRDHIAQAISEYVATKSGRWNTTEESDLTSGNAISYEAADMECLTRILSRQISEEVSWLQAIKDLKTEAIEIDYEDLTASPDRIIRDIFAHLKINFPDGFSPQMRFKKITNRESVELFRAQYLADLQGRNIISDRN